nr:uncharacterized protein LOC117226764 [Megalopta genalis]XP_033337317.1 uncharacterized protein LOC117226764 [Megalopta genalis]XP_033337318.1 uncharacterized protein LOC117226764 [Megalopta genalis]
MESVSPLPVKNSRKLIEKDIGKPIIECKREFTLTQQFPSRVPNKRPSCESTVPQTSSNSLSNGGHTVNKLKKMRIRTQDGKDLGEFNLKFLPPEYLNETTVSDNFHLTRNINMPITLFFENAGRATKVPQTQNSDMLNNDVQYVDYDNLDKNTTENHYNKFHSNKITIQNNQALILPKGSKVIKRKDNSYNAIIKRRSTSSNIVTKGKTISDIIVIEKTPTFGNRVTKGKTSPTNAIAKYMPSSNNVILKEEANCDNIEASIFKENDIETSNFKENITETAFTRINILRRPKMKVNSIEQSTGVPKKLLSKDYVSERIVSTKYVPETPIFKKSVPEKLISNDCVLEKLQSSKIAVSERSVLKCKTPRKPEIEATTVKKSETMVHASKKSVTKDDTSKLKEYLIQSKFPLVACEKLIIPKDKGVINGIDQIINKIHSDKSNSSLLHMEGKNESGQCLNITEISNMQPTKDAVAGNKVQTSPNYKRTFIEQIGCNAQGNDYNSVPVSNEPTNTDPCFEANDSSTNNSKKITSSELKPQNLLQHWDIIKEALISVKDEELRAKALQALTDCGIGIAKHVPIIPPENLKTVHDSQVQTDVFGLLELDNFILVTETTPILKRINQKNRSATTSMIISNVSPQDSVNKHNNYNNNNQTLDMHLLLAEDLDEINNFFNKNENSTAKEVEQILTDPSYSLRDNQAICTKVIRQLKRDFQSLQNWDEKGMLSIHKAVIDDDLQEVKRLLLVLKACRISINVLTEDYKTCLELAIQSNASEDMVKLLLEAGATPVSLEPLHESAIIIACKLCSPLLFIMLQYVTNHELLNKVDEHGFAPLHYCALRNNLDGVSALLKTKVNVNLRDNRSGRTPIFHAIENNHISIARELLVHGAIVAIPNFSGQSIMTLIEETKSLSLRAALKQIIS